MRENIVVFDLETTGLDVQQDEVIEFGAWRVIEGQEPKALHFFVRPQKKVPAKVLKLTGIKEEQLIEAQPISVYTQEIIDFFSDAVLVGHNVSFDLAILENSLGLKLNYPVWDTLELARIFYPSLSHYRLAYLAEKLNLKAPDGLMFHRAKDDAWMTWQLLEACWHKGLTFDIGFFEQVKELVKGWKGQDFFVSLKKEITRNFPERPIRTDLVLASSNTGLFTEEDKQNKTLDTINHWVENCFSSGGILERNLPWYESRLGQVKMANAVATALSASQHFVVEAGTGTGKSLAYLIPSLYWAKQVGKKVIVATHTIPLQEQLIKKDLPVLKVVFPFPFKVAILKGMGNYCCLKKWLSLHDFQLNDEEKVAALIVAVWLRETTSGDFQELPQIPGIFGIRAKLRAESETCVPGKCSHAGDCFMLRARKNAEDSDLVIVNHSLLFSDVKTDFNVLPDYEYLVVDEAHHLYQSALEKLGIELCFERIERVIARIYRPVGVNLVNNIKNRLGYLVTALPSVSWDSLTGYLREIPELCSNILIQARELFQLLEGVLADRQSFRLRLSISKETWWKPLNTQLENLNHRIQELSSILKIMVSLFSGEEAELADELSRELSASQTQLESLREGFPYFLNLEHPERVTWLEKSGGSIYLKTSPVEVSGLLQEKIFSRLKSAVLTSATLSIAGSFNHFLSEIGLNKDTLTLQVESPFNYNEQMSFFVVKDFLKPGLPPELGAVQTAEFIAEVAGRIGGRTLVLFTSHKFLRETYFPLRDLLERVNLDILAQGIDGGRSVLLESFLRSPQAVLLGANSFWEGIDIPGEALSCVILVKLPFWPPSMPLIEARSELLTAKGINPFNELLLPEAVIRFKQGFGRLIRTKIDRGTVILLDSRIIEKQYGKVFLSSLPVETHFRGNKEQILHMIESWR